MAPNLKAFSIKSIRFSFEIELPVGLAKQITKESPPDKDDDSVFADIYKVGNTKYGSSVLVSKTKKKEANYQISFDYKIISSRKRKLGFPHIDRALQILSNIDGTVKLECFSTFEFTKRDKVKTIVSLPITVSESPYLPFNEIRGLHLSRMEEKHPKCDIILDRDRDGTLNETLLFSYEAKISETLLDEVVSEAVKVSNSLVFMEKQYVSQR